MATDIILPKLGFAMTEAKLVEWFVGDGDEVRQGAPLYAIETDKSTLEIEAPESGAVRIAAEPGQVYEVGVVLGSID